MPLRFFPAPRLPVEPSQAKVALGDEGTHSELLGERARLLVGFGRPLDVRNRLVGRDQRREPEGIGLASALLSLSGERQGFTGRARRVGRPAREEVALSPPGNAPTRRTRIRVARRAGAT